jgi:hypothetical protein
VTAALTRLPRAAGPASPAQVGRVLLSWVEAWWAERADPADPAAPQPLPDARFMAGGDPRTVAWDSDAGQVTVALDRIVMGADPITAAVTVRSPRADPGNHMRITRHAVYEVQIVRPAPSLSYAGSIPGGTAIDAHGYELMGDIGHLATCLADGIRAGAFLREHVGQGQMILGDAESLGPSGALAGVACGLTVPLL